MFKRIGIVDSGYSPEQASYIFASQRLMLTAKGVEQTPVQPDVTGHGSAVIEIIRMHQPRTRFAVAQVFDQDHRASVEQVVAGIDWLLEQQVELINLSLGLREPQPSLHAALQRAKAQGVLLMASSPAMGPKVYPAAYPEVISITSDGRCTEPAQFYRLKVGNAQFGAHGYGPKQHVGSSMACAHFAGLWAKNTLEG